jgi:hypothetical protein
MAIYSASFTLCITSILLVNLRSDMAGLLLIVLGAGVFIVIRKMGYLEYCFFTVAGTGGLLCYPPDPSSISATSIRLAFFKHPNIQVIRIRARDGLKSRAL